MKKRTKTVYEFSRAKAVDPTLGSGIVISRVHVPKKNAESTSSLTRSSCTSSRNSFGESSSTSNEELPEATCLNVSKSGPRRRSESALGAKSPHAASISRAQYSPSSTKPTSQSASSPHTPVRAPSRLSLPVTGRQSSSKACPRAYPTTPTRGRTTPKSEHKNLPEIKAKKSAFDTITSIVHQKFLRRNPRKTSDSSDIFKTPKERKSITNELSCLKGVVTPSPRNRKASRDEEEFVTPPSTAEPKHTQELSADAITCIKPENGRKLTDPDIDTLKLSNSGTGCQPAEDFIPKWLDFESYPDPFDDVVSSERRSVSEENFIRLISPKPFVPPELDANGQITPQNISNQNTIKTASFDGSSPAIHVDYLGHFSVLPVSTKCDNVKSKSNGSDCFCGCQIGLVTGHKAKAAHLIGYLGGLLSESFFPKWNPADSRLFFALAASPLPTVARNLPDPVQQCSHLLTDLLFDLRDSETFSENLSKAPRGGELIRRNFEEKCFSDRCNESDYLRQKLDLLKGLQTRPIFKIDFANPAQRLVDYWSPSQTPLDYLTPIFKIDFANPAHRLLDYLSPSSLDYLTPARRPPNYFDPLPHDQVHVISIIRNGLVQQNASIKIQLLDFRNITDPLLLDSRGITIFLDTGVDSYLNFIVAVNNFDKSADEDVLSRRLVLLYGKVSLFSGEILSSGEQPFQLSHRHLKGLNADLKTVIPNFEQFSSAETRGLKHPLDSFIGFFAKFWEMGNKISTEQLKKLKVGARGASARRSLTASVAETVIARALSYDDATYYSADTVRSDSFYDANDSELDVASYAASPRRVWSNPVFQQTVDSSDSTDDEVKEFGEKASDVTKVLKEVSDEFAQSDECELVAEEEKEDSKPMGIFSTGRRESSTFGVTRHRKVEPATSVQLGAASPGSQPYRKDEPQGEDGFGKKQNDYKLANFFDSNVLRKVANITMDRNSVEKPTKKMIVPSKLDFRNCEKFEGHMLVNWLLLELDEEGYQRHSVVQLELRQLVIQFCTMLLHAHVIRLVEDPNVNGVDMLFKLDVIYHWASSESSQFNKLNPATWAPPLPIEIQGSKTSKPSEAEFQQGLANLKRDHNDALDRLRGDYDEQIFKIRGEYGEKICQLEDRIASLTSQLKSLKESSCKGEPPPYVPPPPPPPPIPCSGAPPPPPLPPICGAPPPPPPPLPCVPFVPAVQDAVPNSSVTPRICLPPPPPPGPNPLPPPPPGGICGWNAQTAAARKNKVVPKTAMKPLYWTRIQIIPTTGNGWNPSSQYDNSIWESLEEDKPLEWEDFEERFSRQSTEKPKPAPKVEKPSKQQVAKLLDPKRSQNLGILISSQHLCISDVQQALMNFDTDVVPLETLRSINSSRATEEEIQGIKFHIDSQPDQPLDKPEQFLYELSCIPHFEDRMFCFMFQNTFNEAIAVIQSTLDNMQMVCDMLLTADGVKRVLGIVLALGNYMNGGNVQRGQADGFSLEILPKLKDVKSRDNTMTLLHFIVRIYMEKHLVAGDAPNPLPEPSDVDKAALVKFEEVEKDLKQLSQELEGCELRSKKVIASSSVSHLHPFKDIMETFIGQARSTVTSTEEHLCKCRDSLRSVMKYFSYSLKNNELDPKDFFCLWSPFCSDFKAQWNREKQRIAQERLREDALIRQQRKSAMDKITKKPSCNEGKGLKNIVRRRSNQIPSDSSNSPRRKSTLTPVKK